MIDLTLGQTSDCRGLKRREFLQVGALGAFGLGLPGLLRAESPGAAPGSGKVANPRERRSVIMMWLQGGPSHIDMFDPKPEAPVDIRGEFGVVPTSQTGVYLCEHMPRLARELDSYSIVRSGYCYNGSHGIADAYMLSGYRFSGTVVYPTYGAIVSKELGYRNGMPPFIQLGTAIDRRFNGGVAGFLGNEYNPFEVAEDPAANQFSIDGIALPSGVSAQRFQRRQTMLDELNNWQKEVETSADGVVAMDSFYEKAFSMVTSDRARKAFDLSHEHPRLRDEYGRNRFGQSCLLARRLIESGVRFITLTDGGWDTHQDNFKSLKDRKLPVLDQGYATLLRDLHDRGMLNDTMVICLGDFGRTPKVNPSAGRDHWAGSTFFTLGGGGLKTGAVIGRSSEYAEQPDTDPIQVEDIAATLYALLGISVDKTNYTPDGRPVKINDSGRVVSELLA